MTIATALVCLAALPAAAWLTRRKQKQVDASFQALSPAVPDVKSIEGAPYRGGEQRLDSLAGSAQEVGAPMATRSQSRGSRKSIAVLDSTRRVRIVQMAMAAAAAPLSALLWGVWPLVASAPLSALLGALWGLALGHSLLDDSRVGLGVTALSLSWVVFLSPWAAVGAVVLYGLARRVLDEKDDAAKTEADRERSADPLYLAGSTERRAGRVSLGRGGAGGDLTAPSARDNSSAV